MPEARKRRIIEWKEYMESGLDHVVCTMGSHENKQKCHGPHEERKDRPLAGHGHVRRSTRIVRALDDRPLGMW